MPGQLIIGSYEVRPTSRSAPDVQEMAGGLVFAGTYAANTSEADMIMQAALREDGFEVVDVDWIEAAAALDTSDAALADDFKLITDTLEDPASGGVGYGQFEMYRDPGDDE